MSSILYGGGLYGAGLFGGGPSTFNILVEAAFGSYPSDASYTWTGIHNTDVPASGYVKGIRWQRGIGDLIGRTETGTGNLTLLNSSRAWDPENVASPFYPNVQPDLPVRAYAVLSGTTYPLFQHFMDGFPRRRTGPNTAEVDDTTTDGFAALALASPSPDLASLTIDPAGVNNELVYTARNPGMAELDTTIQYIGGPFKPVRVAVKGRAIEIRYHLTGLHGDPDDTATTVKNAVNGNAGAAALVTVTDAPGSDGTGTILTDSGPSNLAGADAALFPRELTGDRIVRCLDQADWPAALRDISPGTVYCSQSSFSSTEQGRLLSHVLDVASEGAEFAMVYVDGAGNCTFLDRDDLYTNTNQATPTATFTDNPGAGFPTYSDASPEYGRDTIINEWVGSSDGGVAQTVQNTASIAKHRRISRQVASLLEEDIRVRTAMQFGCDEYGNPVQRLRSITVRPGNDQTAWAACLGVELGDRVRVLEHPPGGGAAIDKLYHVVHLQGEIFGHLATGTFTFGLWPIRISNYFLFDDPGTFGNLNTSVLPYN